MEEKVQTKAEVEEEAKVETVESRQNFHVLPQQDHFERRWHEIVDGHAYPLVPSFPAIRFNPITRKERAIANRIYNEKLAELREEDKKLRAEGKPGYLDELDVELEVRAWAEARGWNVRKIQEEHNIYIKRMIAEAPFELTRSSLQKFSADEIAQMTPETRLQYEKEELERQRKYTEWIRNNTTEEERETREKAYLLELKTKELESVCLQRLADAYRSLALMMINASDETGNQYFVSNEGEPPPKENTPEYRTYIRKLVDQWENLDVPEMDAVLLYTKWKQWEEGREMDFMSPWS